MKEGVLGVFFDSARFHVVFDADDLLFGTQKEFSA